MSDAMSSGLDALEDEYRRLAGRWYPRSWLDSNGDALVGTLMEVAEARGLMTVPVSLRLDLARRGLALRLASTLEREVRDRVASISVGASVGFSLVLVLTNQARTDLVYSPGSGSGPVDMYPARLLELTPFLAVWLLAACLAFVPRRALNALALVIAAAVTITSSSLWFDDSISEALRAGWSNWWSSVGWSAPASIPNLVLLLSAGVLARLGRPRLPVALGAAMLTACVAVGDLFLQEGQLSTRWTDWFWTPTWGVHMGFASVPSILLLVVLAAVILTRLGRSGWAVAISVSAVPVLLGWIAELVANPQIVLY